MPAHPLYIEDVRALFFDVDETIFKVVPSVAFHYQAVLSSFNCNTSEESITRNLATAWRELKPYYENQSGGYQTFHVREREIWREFSRRVVSGLGFHPEVALLDALYERFADGSTRDIQPGFVELLESCSSRGLTTGIFTNNDSRVKRVCAYHKIDSLLTYQFSACELGYKKPSPLAFKRIEEISGIFGGQNLYVGNSIEHDYEGALSAGWQALLFAPTAKTQQEAISRGIPFIRSFIEMHEQFSRL